MAKQSILERDAWGEHIRTNRPKVAKDAPPLRKYMNTEVEKGDVDPATGMRRYTFVASTGAVDREGDIIFPDGWELENYEANPVILWAHESWSYPIGKATKVKLKGKKLMVTVEFTPADVNPEGYKVYKLVEAGFVNAVSVGFRPRSWVWNDEHAGYDFQSNELLEVSVVPVPANQEALLAAGLDAGTAKWYGGLSKGAAAAVVLDEIIKTAMSHNRTNTPVPAGGGSAKEETAPQALFVSCNAGPASEDWTSITYTNTSGDTLDGSVWYDKDYTQPYTVGDQLPADTGWRMVLPDEFVWPPPPDTTKEVDMEQLEKLEKGLDALTELVQALPGAIKDALTDALAPPPADDDPAEPAAADPVDDPVDPVADPATDAAADTATDTDDDADDDAYLEVEGLTDDGLHVMVEEVMEEARTATTGRLPD